MDWFDHNAIDPSQSFTADFGCEPDITQALTVAHVVQGMDPLQAVLEAQLQAPLIQPLLF